jgi:hypothetical protein
MDSLFAMVFAFSFPPNAPQTPHSGNGVMARAMVTAEILPAATSTEERGPGAIHRQPRHRHDLRAAVEFE